MHPYRETLYKIIFEAETPAGKLFDVALLWVILLSVAVVCLESVDSIRLEYGQALRYSEWFFTGLFTLEYLARLLCVRKPMRYALSFYGFVDLLSILPTYLAFFIGGVQSLLVVRSLRLLRVFRVLKLGAYVAEGRVLMKALRGSQQKITVFLVAVLSIMLIAATLMYLIEGQSNGFNSIPKALYWAIVTMTTVGYGDITPQTVLGQTVASFLMLTGYAVIAIPTGIFSAEMLRAAKGSVSTKTCPSCTAEGHESDALCCKFCGTRLADPVSKDL